MYTLIYDEKTERWQAYGNEGDSCVIRCGYCLDINVDGRFLTARVEFDTAWYVILENARFHLHPRQRYTVRL